MDRDIRACRNNRVITVQSHYEKHRRIIRSVVAKRVYQLFEQPGYKYGLNFADWVVEVKLVDRPLHVHAPPPKNHACQS